MNHQHSERLKQRVLYVFARRDDASSSGRDVSPASTHAERPIGDEYYSYGQEEERDASERQEDGDDDDDDDVRCE